MDYLRNKRFRHIALGVAICLLGFLLAYFSGGLLPRQEATPQPAEPSSPVEPAPAPEEPADSPEEPVLDGGVNYYVRLNRGLSSAEEALVLTTPVELRASVEYRGQNCERIVSDAQALEDLLAPLQNAPRLEEEAQLLSTSSSRAVSLTLPYSDGCGSLYIFSATVDGGKKPVTVVQDNVNRLYQCKAAVVDQLYDLVKPVETSLDAERLSLYGGRNYEKGSLLAQTKEPEAFELILSTINSLEKQGSSLDLPSPDYLLCLLPHNSVSEKDYAYLWVSEKQLLIAFADDSSTVYRSTNVSASQLKRWVKDYKVK